MQVQDLSRKISANAFLLNGLFIEFKLPVPAFFLPKLYRIHVKKTVYA